MGECSLQDGVIAYFELKKRIADAGVSPKVDLEYAMAAYARVGNNWYSYDTVETLKRKVCYARHHSLGGVMTWDGQQDTLDYELLRAIKGFISGSDVCKEVNTVASCMAKPANLVCDSPVSGEHNSLHGIPMVECPQPGRCVHYHTCMCACPLGTI
jgi:hypothetical protein